MGDLRINQARLDEMYNYQVSRESIKRYFYCDNHGLVTTGIGYLVDESGAEDAIGRGLARRVAHLRGVVFLKARGAGATATPDEVVDDWQRVKDHGRAHPNSRATSFEPVAQLRLTEPSVRRLYHVRVGHYADRLYRERPYVLNFDERVAMAFVDYLYNPPGSEFALFGRHPDIVRMWQALNPAGPAVDVAQGIDLFERVGNRGTDQYRQRHQQRVEWMRAGFQAMQAASVFSTPPSPGPAREMDRSCVTH